MGVKAKIPHFALERVKLMVEAGQFMIQQGRELSHDSHDNKAMRPVWSTRGGWGCARRTADHVQEP